METQTIPVSPIPPIQPVQPIQPPQSAKNSNSLVIILSILLLIAVSLAGFFYLQTKKTSKKLSKYQIQPSSIQTITIDPTANWKTYTNHTYGFSLKYPFSWKELTTDEEKARGNVGYTNLFTIIETDKNEFIEVTVLDGTPDTSNNLAWSKNIALKGNKFVSIAYTDNLGPGSKGGEKDIKIFDQILSTFKFVDTGNLPSTIPTTNSKCVEKGSLNCAKEIELSFECTEEYQSWAKINCPGWGNKVNCKDSRPQVCTMECAQPPPYICGSDGKSYCSVCQACSNKNVAWYEMKASACTKEEIK